MSTTARSRLAECINGHAEPVLTEAMQGKADRDLVATGKGHLGTRASDDVQRELIENHLRHGHRARAAFLEY